MSFAIVRACGGLRTAGVRLGVARCAVGGGLHQTGQVMWSRGLSSKGYKVSPLSEDATGEISRETPFGSNAEKLIDEVPVVVVDKQIVVCDGGGGTLGHPIEYIQLNKEDPTIPTACIYCGIRYVLDPNASHGH